LIVAVAFASAQPASTTQHAAITNSTAINEHHISASHDFIRYSNRGQPASVRRSRRSRSSTASKNADFSRVRQQLSQRSASAAFT
jgi:hypothetical protein